MGYLSTESAGSDLSLGHQGNARHIVDQQLRTCAHPLVEKLKRRESFQQHERRISKAGLVVFILELGLRMFFGREVLSHETHSIKVAKGRLLPVNSHDSRGCYRWWQFMPISAWTGEL